MQTKRFDELEGLRGIAAVVVTIYHFLLAFYLYAFFGPSGEAVQQMRFEDNLYGNPLGVFFSGTFAVAIFFVLSGFVLSIGFFKSGDMNVIKKLATKRYVRLMFPALASTLLCFAAIYIAAPIIQQAGAITHSSWLIGQWQFEPTLFDALKSGVYDIFLVSGSLYNNVLWTMAIEFAGSFLIFGYLAIFGKLQYRWIGYGALLLATFNTWFFAFVAGMIIADMYAKGHFRAKKRPVLLVFGLISCSLALGGYPLNNAEGSAIYGILPSLNSSINWQVVLLSFGAIGLMVAVLVCEGVSKFFAHRWLSRLGKYTFSLYLIHIPVIYSVGLISFLFVYETLGLGYHAAALCAFIACVPVFVTVTVLFEKYVDAPSVAASSKFAQLLLNEENMVYSMELIAKRWAAFVDRFGVLWENNNSRRRQAQDIEEQETA